MQRRVIKLRKGKTSLHEDLQEPNTIEHLELHSESLIELPLELAGLENLKKLELFMPSLSALPDWITWAYPKLSLLRLKRTKLEGLPVLNEKTTKLNQLTILSLAQNQLKKLPENLELLASLEVLELYHNQLNALPESFGALVRLKRLNLDSNQLASLPQSFWTLKNLAHLSLDNNPLSDEQKQKLFDHFGIWF
jgi:Leucine-rich repeat (LRR) protein